MHDFFSPSNEVSHSLTRHPILPSNKLNLAPTKAKESKSLHESFSSVLPNSRLEDDDNIIDKIFWFCAIVVTTKMWLFIFMT